MREITGKLKALADGTRFKMVRLLLDHDLCAGALARRLGISGAAVSQHLRLLKEQGLVQGEKRGYWTHYSVNRAALAEIAASLAALAAPGRRGGGGCTGGPGGPDGPGGAGGERSGE